MRPKVVIFIYYFLPGIKSGGPVRSILNLVRAFSNKVDFSIVCNYGDIDNTNSEYLKFKMDEWNDYNGLMVFYTDMKTITYQKIEQIISGFDYVYCCGIYDIYARHLMKINKRKNINLILATMGSLEKNALSKKALKKRIYLSFMKTLGLFKNVTFSATSQKEAESIKYIFKNNPIKIASDIPTFQNTYSENLLLCKDANKNVVIFVGRISPIKNLDYAIDVLQFCESNIEFNIYGPLEEQSYWDKCKKKLEKLPKNIKWKYYGSLNYDEVSQVFLKSHIFLFPTQSENFGHVIFESLNHGCVPFISNNTPFDFDSNVGKIFDLEDSKEDIAINIDKIFKNRDLFEKMSINSFNYSLKLYKKIVDNSGYIDLFGVDIDG